jgi:hypothetical protein
MGNATASSVFGTGKLFLQNGNNKSYFRLGG